MKTIMSFAVGLCIAAGCYYGLLRGEWARGAFFLCFAIGCHLSVLDLNLSQRSSGGDK